MRRVRWILILIAIMLVLSSCSVNEENNKNRLSSPTNNKPPIEGKWIITEHINAPELEVGKDDIIAMGTEGLFNEGAIILAGDYTMTPSYKIKTVKTLDYLLYKYKLTPMDLEIEADQIQVVTILNDNQYFNELIKCEDYFIVNIENHFYKMEQTAEEVSLDEVVRYIDIEKAMIRDVETTETEKKETGVLLGLKIPRYDTANDLPLWEYKTMWIKSKDKNIDKVYEVDELLAPRKNGFITVDISRDVKPSRVKDVINISSDSNQEKNSESFLKDRIENYKADRGSSGLKNILFLGNNYISIENIEVENDSRKTLGMYAIDNIKDEKPIKLSDIIGENGKDIFTEGVQNVMSLDDINLINESNISLVRKNGYWVFNGRINYRQNESELYKDFNIREIPPKEVVNFDEHLISWEAVKRQIPEAIDMYTSPNEEFIIVITNYNLQVYTIENRENISQQPSIKVNLPKNASIIMSEWATGRYVDLWEKEVIRREGKITED